MSAKHEIGAGEGEEDPNGEFGSTIVYYVLDFTYANQ
jgi:hypothetical protein